MQNLFDVAGASGCTVTVAHGLGSSPIALWSGTLLKGQQSPVFNGLGGVNEQVQATVNLDGSVQLDWISGTQTSDGYDLRVTPNEAVSTNAAQLQGMQVNPLALSGTRGWVYVDTGNDAIDLTVAGSSASPDPCLFSPTPSPNFLGLMFYMGTQL